MVKSMFACVLLVGLVAAPSGPHAARQDDPFADLAPPAPEEQGERPPPGRDGTYAMRFADDDARLATGLHGPAQLAAIDAGLAWLVAQQAQDGAWAEGDVRTTTIALLALLGDGHTPIDGEHTAAVALGVGWLRAQQAGSGALGSSIGEHAPATLALAEAARFSADEEIAAAARRALLHLVTKQSSGAWADGTDGEAEAALTAWGALALVAGVDAGLVERDALSQAAGWIAENTRASGAVKRRRGAPGNRNREAAAALYARLAIRGSTQEVTDTQADRLLKRSALPAWPEDGERVDLEYWFFGAHALGLFDLTRWAAWEKALSGALLDHQSAAGSWPDVATAEESTGEIYATAFAVLALEAPFRSTKPVSVAAVGGAAAGKFGGRFGGRPGLRTAGGSGTTEPLQDALNWLVDHQAQDGRWDCDGFREHKPEGVCACDGAGDEFHDGGVTGLALLALMGDGNTAGRGALKDNVVLGIRWLLSQQDPATGRIASSGAIDSIYDHILATLALTECYHFSKSPVLEPRVQAAIDYLQLGRNRGAGFRYEVPPDGKSDMSVTAWATITLFSAKEAGLAVDEHAFESILSWLDAMTDPTTGRVGYDVTGSSPARLARDSDQFPADRSEAMTAAGLLTRFFLGQDPKQEPILGKHGDLLLTCPPEWDESGGSIDMYYWYWGSYATWQLGGHYWSTWNSAMKPIVLEHQRRDGHFKGSWDPVGVWGSSGGRVYSTAMMALTLEVYFRYARVLGAR